MRVLVTGSRDWADRKLLYDTLIDITKNWDDSEGLPVLVHGDCPTGADSMAKEVWTKYWFWTEEPHPAQWYSHDENCYHTARPAGFCPAAGPRRNKEMVSLGADVCVAFIKNNSSGASGTAKMAEGAGIKTIRITE